MLKRRKENRLNLRKQGTACEQTAAAYLETQGYRILEKNFYSRYGEIDLIADDTGVLVFNEVKYRTDTAVWSPEEAVDRRKQRKICKTADYYRLRHQIAEDTPCRFDVIAITPEHIVLYQDAFPYQW